MSRLNFRRRVNVRADFMGGEPKGTDMTWPSVDDTDLPLSALFEAWPAVASVFIAYRMLCFGCPIAPFHTVIDACAEYRLDEDVLRAQLRAAARA
jgi:hybrid cluster-associated redox disulfide protein